jgi:hypothetical protein
MFDGMHRHESMLMVVVSIRGSCYLSYRAEKHARHETSARVRGISNRPGHSGLDANACAE